MSQPILRTLLTLVLAAAAAGCSRETPVEHREFLAFGTLVSVDIYGAEPALAREAMAEVEADFHYMHKTWHPWQPSALARVNTLLATTEWFSVAPSVRPLIVKAQHLSRASDGLFNPAIGRLVKLWGFHQDPRPGGAPPPDPEQIAALVEQHPAMEALELDGIRLRSTNAAVTLDFGGFAKGYGVDRAIEQLRQRGIDNAIVNAGGDLRAIGRHGDRPWRIGIRNPRGPGYLASLEVAGDESVFTSGDYERYFDYQGKRYHHILDPRTGYPAEGVTSVTVVHDGDAATADAAATALFVAGPDHWRPIARSLGVRYVMLVDKRGRVHMNPAMAERIHFETEQEPTVILSEPL